MNDLTLARPDWDKGGGLLPAIVQHAVDCRILMLGYMNDRLATPPSGPETVQPAREPCQGKLE